MASPSLGMSVHSVEFGYGTIDFILANGNFGVRYLNKDYSYNDTPSIIVWYNKDWARIAEIKTKQTLFTSPQEILPITLGSLV